MLTIRTPGQMRTSRQLRGFRACATSTGVPRPGAECDRLCRETTAVANRELRRAWLAAQWRAHQERVRQARAV